MKFGIILLTSAYHHVEDKFKSKLLQKIFEMMRDDGVLIIYEKIISPYSNEREWAESNEQFYLKRIEYLRKTEKEKLTKKQFNALMNLCALSVLKEEEYKTDYNYLVKDLRRTGFKVLKETKIWPKQNLFCNEKVGDFVFVAKKPIKRKN
ncbi:MAG: hypothetical protein AB1467_02730 [Candidatus Diapherotrites archaeon]